MEGLDEIVLIVEEAQLLLAVATQREAVALVAVALIHAHALLPYSIEGVDVERNSSNIGALIGEELDNSCIGRTHHHSSILSQLVVCLLADVQQRSSICVAIVLADQIDTQVGRQLCVEAQIERGSLRVVEDEWIVSSQQSGIGNVSPRVVVHIAVVECSVRGTVVDIDAHGWC